MTTISRYDPFREALTLRNAMDQLFAQSFVSPQWINNTVDVDSNGRL
jgi:HSP20 family protein